MNQIISQFQLFFAQQVNQLIYTIINFKPLKGLISEEWYARSDIKKTLGILCLIWNGLKDIFCWLSLYRVRSYNRISVGAIIRWHR